MFFFFKKVIGLKFFFYTLRLLEVEIPGGLANALPRNIKTDLRVDEVCVTSLRFRYLRPISYHQNI